MTTIDRGPVIDSPHVHGVPIARVSEELGVPMPTLRSWEIRYGIPTTDRTGGQHRRYTPAHLHALRLMCDQMARGHRAAAAAAVHALVGTSGAAGDLVRQILTAATQLDPAAITRAIELGAATLGAGASIDQVVLAAPRQVGDWNHGQACGSGDLHTIGLEALGMLLRRQGWPCKILGAVTPTARLNSITAARSAAAVVITLQLVSGRRQAAASVHQWAGEPRDRSVDRRYRQGQRHRGQAALMDSVGEAVTRLGAVRRPGGQQLHPSKLEIGVSFAAHRRAATRRRSGTQDDLSRVIAKRSPSVCCSLPLGTSTAGMASPW